MWRQGLSHCGHERQLPCKSDLGHRREASNLSPPGQRLSQGRNWLLKQSSTDLHSYSVRSKRGRVSRERLHPIIKRIISSATSPTHRTLFQPPTTYLPLSGRCTSSLDKKRPEHRLLVLLTSDLTPVTDAPITTAESFLPISPTLITSPHATSPRLIHPLPSFLVVLTSPLYGSCWLGSEIREGVQGPSMSS